MPSPLTANNATSKSAAADSSHSSEWHKEGSSGSRTESFNHFQPSEKTYEEVSVIGTGAYGTVYKAKDLANKGQYVALKKVKIPLAEDGVPINTLREIALLKQLDTYDHPNVVRLLDICHGQRMEHEQQMVLYLVFEHVDQDLSTYLEKCPSPGLGPDRIKDIMYQLLNGIDFLHSNRIVHRDLKPQNILISNHGVLKLADFGLARIFDSKMILTSVVVTLWYRPPEVLLQRTYATPVDVWSSGCIFAELFRRKPLFTGVNEIDQLMKIFEVIGSPLESQWPTDVSLPWTSFKFYRGVPFTTVIPEICPEGADLIQSMLMFGPSQRITCSQALHHPYFSEYELNPPSSARYSSRSVTFGYHSRSNGVRRIS